MGLATLTTPDLAAVLGFISFCWFWSALFNGTFKG